MTDQSTPAEREHEIQHTAVAGDGCADDQAAGVFALPFGIVLFLLTAGTALLNTVLWELGTPPDISWPLMIAVPLMVIVGALRMR